jgi:hypothetical protein
LNDDLYANLDWLCENQSRIEDRLFTKTHDRLHRDGKPGLFLYDVTSSYLEGECNELAAFGYNRDGKKGKRQIVVGLLCDGAGRPLSIEVFAGNTRDAATLAPQIRKAADRFGGGEVTFVGDRGMPRACFGRPATTGVAYEGQWGIASCSGTSRRSAVHRGLPARPTSPRRGVPVCPACRKRWQRAARSRT